MATKKTAPKAAKNAAAKRAPKRVPTTKDASAKKPAHALAGAKRPRVILLDSHAIMHRAYHALPEFTSDSGEPTGALYGLVSMLVKMVHDLSPEYIIAAYDLPGGTHRHEVYEEYKGTRGPLDDALARQLNRAPEVYEAFGIPAIGVKGFEADDILGTLAHRLRDTTEADVIIATGDHDTLQLVDDSRVRVYTLRKGLADTVLYDADAVRERYGFGPEHIADYKGLAGDPSDNIKGVKGIGQKSATELIAAFGGIEDIYRVLEAHPERFAEAGIKPRVQSLLIEGKDDAIFSKMLATIRTDAPVVYELPKETWRESFDVSRALTLCDDLGFRSLGGRVRSLTPGIAFDREQDAADADAASADDPRELAEAKVMLWLLHSDMTNPDREDVLRATKTKTLGEAHAALLQSLRATGRLARVYEEIEKPLIPIVLSMHELGIVVDSAYLGRLSSRYHAELETIVSRIYELAGHEFNLNSPRQLGTVLFDELGLGQGGAKKKTATGQRSTREDELAKLAGEHEIIGKILEYRELQKLLSTYIDNLPSMVAADGRLHARFLQEGTTTGRMASADPNLQNIPTKPGYGKPIRDAFRASEGYQLVAIDYSQIELRIAAGLSGDERLIEVFREGGDIHRSVASRVFGVPPENVDAEMRRRAKVINFGILYGMGVNALRANLGDAVSRADAAAYLAGYFANYAGLAAYIERVKADAARLGYTETLFGRRRSFAGFDSPLPYVRAAAERMAVNAPIQGTQADIIKLAMVRADRALAEEGASLDARLLLQVHDELVYEIMDARVHELAKLIRGIMESVAPEDGLSGVPIIAEVSAGKTWGSLSRIERKDL
ncbi:MAG TPA: DNA polymerase [Candidatus Paceibacterota bacterium]|nr:DNA polymerase [Candidatus Paceibacterota bacterium]